MEITRLCIALNRRRYTKREILSCLIYGIAIIAWAGAIHCILRTKNLLDDMSLKMTIAADLTAISNQAKINVQQFGDIPQTQDEQMAEAMATQSRQDFDESEQDQREAEQDRIRSGDRIRDATEEEQQASEYLDRVHQDQQVLEEMNKTLLLDEADKAEAVNMYHEHVQFACDDWWWWPLCKYFETTIDNVTLRIQKEYQASKNMSQQEYSDSLVASMHEKRAAAYNQTAMELQQAAADLDERAKQAYVEGLVLNQTADELKHEIKDLQAKEQVELDKEMTQKMLADQCWKDADDEYKKAMRYALMAWVLAVSSFVFFASSALRQTFLLVDSLTRNIQEGTISKTQARRIASRVAVHIVIFMFWIGIFKDYFTLPFLITIAAVETIALYTGPSVWAEWQSTQAVDVRMAAKHGALRFIMLMLIRTLEVLFVWVNFGQGKVSSNLKGFFASPLFFVFLLACLCGHLAMFEIKFASTEEESPPSPSEQTPLTVEAPSAEPKADYCGSTVDGYTQTSGESTSTTVTTVSARDPTSPCCLLVKFWEELRLLHLPLELFFVSCMVHVLGDCVPLLGAGVLVILAIICVGLTLPVAIAWWSGYLARPKYLYHETERVEID